AWKSGFAVATFGAKSPWEPPSILTLEPGQAARGVDIALVRGAAISGRVVDDAGEPVSDVQVRVGRAVPRNGRLQYQGVSPAATTDDRGEYRIGGLPAGTFVVSASGWIGSVTAVPGEVLPARPHGSFYPRTPYLGQAQPIVVRGGEDVRAIDVAFTAETLV